MGELPGDDTGQPDFLTAVHAATGAAPAPHPDRVTFAGRVRAQPMTGATGMSPAILWPCSPSAGDESRWPPAHGGDRRGVIYVTSMLRKTCADRLIYGTLML
jgi:hypothetical protein